MNLKYSQIQIVVTSSKYCVKSRNESCVPFLSNCNTFIQSLQLKVFAGKEDLGREVPQGSSGYREDVSLSEKQQDQVWPWLRSCQSHAEAFSYLCCAPEGPQLSPYQQLVTRCGRGSGRPPPVGTSSFLFLFRIATSEVPASQLPDIFSETLCWRAEPYRSILPLRIPSMSSFF